MKILVVPVMYGEIPQHVRHTFGLDRPDSHYYVGREGEDLPDASIIQGVMIVHGDNSFDAREAQGVMQQMRSFYAGTPVMLLPVQLEVEEEYTQEYLSSENNSLISFVPKIWADKVMESMAKSLDDAWNNRMYTAYDVKLGQGLGFKSVLDDDDAKRFFEMEIK